LRKLTTLFVGLVSPGVASCGGGPSSLYPLSKGAICFSIGMPFCERSKACGDDDYETSSGAFMGECCTELGTCDDAATALDLMKFTEFDSQCHAALEAEACPDVSAGVLPSARLKLPMGDGPSDAGTAATTKVGPASGLGNRPDAAGCPAGLALGGKICGFMMEPSVSKAAY
jgi:hypothetical protein